MESFQSTSSTRRKTGGRKSGSITAGISIHFLHKEEDENAPDVLIDILHISIHFLHKEEDKNL